VSESDKQNLDERLDGAGAFGDEVVGLVAQGREQDDLDVAQVSAVAREAQLSAGETDDLLAMLADLGIEVVERDDVTVAEVTGAVADVGATGNT
jgi:hypothetical protein